MIAYHILGVLIMCEAATVLNLHIHFSLQY